MSFNHAVTLTVKSSLILELILYTKPDQPYHNAERSVNVLMDERPVN